MIGRRAALGALAVLAAAPAMARRSAEPALATPADRLRAFMLMRGALDDRLVVGCLAGRYVGVVNGETTPLFGFVSATFARFREATDGGYEAVTLEQAYFLDLATGERLTRFANPYTGRTVDVPVGGYPPARIRFGTDLVMHIPDAPAGMSLVHRVSPFRVDGDDVWLTEWTDGVTPAPGGGPPLQYHETVTLHARADELARRGAKRVRCETGYVSVKSWRPWLDMAGHPGETVSTGEGLYGATLAELPAAWIRAARRHRPALLADPAGALDAARAGA